MTRQHTANDAWLEWEGGGPVTLGQSCSIGRAVGNQVVFASDDVSRRHAVINEEGPGDFHIIDLGSSNGTFVNGRRVTRSTPLADGDAVQIGPFKLLFRQRSTFPSRMPPDRLSGNDPLQTVRPIKGAEYWLVLADLASFSALSRRLKPEELPAVLDGWFHQCRDVLERHGGAIDNCLGDGFLAYWPGRTAAEQVAAGLAELKVLRDGGALPFRIAVHYGDVFVGGGSVASGVERFFGPQVNFVFKLERLASALGRPGLMSAPAHERLQGKLDATPLGDHEIPGFPGTFSLYIF